MNVCRDRFVVLGSVLALEAQQAPSLKIVVLEGEGAVNIIQQKTAVRPLVEVRDRNNLPVAGASVTFSIGGGGQARVCRRSADVDGDDECGRTGRRVGPERGEQRRVSDPGAGRVSRTDRHGRDLADEFRDRGGGRSGWRRCGRWRYGIGRNRRRGRWWWRRLSATTIGIIGAAVGGGALVATQVVAKGSDEESFDGYNGSLSGQLT